MPRLRVRIPVSIPVEEEDLDVLRAVGRLVGAARESGLVDALKNFVDTADRAEATKRERRRRRRSGGGTRA